MEPLMQFKDHNVQRLLKLLFILSIIFFVAVVVITSLLLWVVLKPAVEHHQAQVNNGDGSGPISCPRSPPLFPLPSPLPDEIKKALDTIDARLTDLVENPKDTGNRSALSVKIVYQNTTLLNGNYGSKVFKGTVAPDDNTRYRIGSVTKIFAVLLLFKLYDDGVVRSLDDPLNKYAPNFFIKNPFGMTYNITLRQMASQMSGLPREAPCGYLCKNTNTIQELTMLKHHHLVVKPWTIPSYSNLGFELLGRILTENLLKTTFEIWVKEKILDPLGMTNTGFEITKDVKENMALPYHLNGSRMAISDIGWANPAGGMYSTTKDLMKLANILIQPDDQHILKPETVRQMLISDFITHDGVWLWGTPWEMRFIGGYLIRQKIGNIDSYNALLSIIPELKLTFCTLINVKPAVKDNGFSLANSIHTTLIPAFTKSLLGILRKGHFPIPAKPFLGKYLLSKLNLITGKIYNVTVAISEYEDTLQLKAIDGAANEYTIKYIGNPLVFRAVYVYKECLSSHLGAFAILRFDQPGEDGLSKAFTSEEWRMNGTRI